MNKNIQTDILEKLVEDENGDVRDAAKETDGKPIQISEKLTVVFYYKEPQKESYYGYVNKQIESGNSTLILGMNTKVNTPKEIAEMIVGMVKNNPLNLKSFFITIVYNGKGEKENIIKELGLKENEVFENLRRQTNG